MISKEINKEQFAKAVRVAFTDDKHIYGLYNPNVSVKSVDDIVNDITHRIATDTAEGAIIKGVYEKGVLIGYYVYDSNMKTLVSFGINVAYRTRRLLQNTWTLIRHDLKGIFQAFLWTRNIRGVKWLQKNGMKIIAQNDLLTQLILE